MTRVASSADPSSGVQQVVGPTLTLFCKALARFHKGTGPLPTLEAAWEQAQALPFVQRFIEHARDDALGLSGAESSKVAALEAKLSATSDAAAKAAAAAEAMGKRLALLEGKPPPTAQSQLTEAEKKERDEKKKARKAANKAAKAERRAAEDAAAAAPAAAAKAAAPAAAPPAKK
eukprot:1708629-Prymnesium_polylepis.2